MDKDYRIFRLTLEEENVRNSLHRLKLEEEYIRFQILKIQQSIGSVREELESLKNQEGILKLKMEKSKEKIDGTKYLADITTLLTIAQNHIVKYRQMEDYLLNQIQDVKHREGYSRTNLDMIREELDHISFG